ncbi:MAG: DUF6134 family protein [Alphaproteobacteria bacterium]
MRYASAIVWLGLGLATPATAAMPPAGTYVYTIDHSQHGEIGTYTNTIRADGDGVTVDTRFEVRVGIGPVTLHREEADRREQWRGGRLVRYDSTTVRNGEDRVVEGRAEGDAFVVRNARGEERAPAGVWPMNPWSPEIVRADTVLASASGRVYPAQVVDAGEATVPGREGDLRARHYRVTADGKAYGLWFDEADRLVRFTAPEGDGLVTFTLTEVR